MQVGPKEIACPVCGDEAVITYIETRVDQDVPQRSLVREKTICGNACHALKDTKTRFWAGVNALLDTY